MVKECARSAELDQYATGRLAKELEFDFAAEYERAKVITSALAGCGTIPAFPKSNTAATEAVLKIRNLTARLKPMPFPKPIFEGFSRSLLD